ncbi:MAG: hypothetical protein E4H13_07995 [Calditrichales bacterium]|nr:MAG: hypothetical protein E4H13_07995 [Calditrichales bacterium]
MLNFDWLSGVSMGEAKAVFLILFALIGVLVLLVPADYAWEGVKVRKWYMNLKIWALGLLVFIAYVYYIF